MDAPQVPNSLNPMAPPPVLESIDLGGPGIVDTKIDNLETQLIANPPTPFAQQHYDSFKQQIKMHNPGLPESEIERMSIEAAQREVNSKAAAEKSVADSQMLNQSRADNLTAKKNQLLGIQTPQTEMAPTDESQFDKPQLLTTPKAPTLNPESVGAVATYGAQAKSLAAIANAQAEMAEKEAIKQEAIEEQTKTQILKQEKMQAEFDGKFNSRMSFIDDISKQMSNPEQVDANRLWNSQSTSQKVMAGIAIALGGYGGALTGKGDNKALDIIMKAIDKDVEVQKFNVQQKGQALRDNANMQQTMLTNLRSKFDNDLQAESALKVLQLQQVQAEFAKMSGKYNSTVIKETAAYNIQELKRAEMGEIAKLRANIAQQTALKNMGTGQNEMDPSVLASYPESTQKIIKDMRERGAPSGWEGMAKDKEAASKFQDKVNEVQSAVEGISRILTLSENLNRLTDITKRAEMATEIQALIGQLRVPLTGPGAMTDRDIKMLQDTIGNPAKVLGLPSVQRAKLMTVRKKLTVDLDNTAKVLGFRRNHSTDKPIANTLKPK